MHGVESTHPRHVARSERIVNRATHKSFCSIGMQTIALRVHNVDARHIREAGHLGIDKCPRSIVGAARKR